MAAFTPDPSGQVEAAGGDWPLKQIAKDIPLTPSARQVLEMGQRFAAQAGAPRVEPRHLLAAIVFLPRNPAHRALLDLGANIEQLEAMTVPGGGVPTKSHIAVPIGATARYVLNNAHRESELVGHHRVDALHMLLGLLYKDSKSTAETLEQAGMSFYTLRQYLTAPSSVVKGLDRRPLPSLDGAIEVSPVFAIPVGATIIGGIGLWVGPPPELIFPLTVLLVAGGWITSLCIHEFGHALVAFLGGDRAVASAGYLSLNPLKYTHPMYSIGLPIAFLVMGGIGLPGGAVFLNERALRNDRWRTFSSAAGPLGNLLFAILIGWPFLVFHGLPSVGDRRFWAALAFLVFLEITAFIFNLIPIPPFDGFGMIEPWLSIEIRVLAHRLGMLPQLLLFFLLWQGGPISYSFWSSVYHLSDMLNIPAYLVFLGHHQFAPWLI